MTSAIDSQSLKPLDDLDDYHDLADVPLLILSGSFDYSETFSDPSSLSLRVLMHTFKDPPPLPYMIRTVWCLGPDLDTVNSPHFPNIFANEQALIETCNLNLAEPRSQSQVDRLLRRLRQPIGDEVAQTSVRRFSEAVSQATLGEGRASILAQLLAHVALQPRELTLATIVSDVGLPSGVHLVTSRPEGGGRDNSSGALASTTHLPGTRIPGRSGIECGRQSVSNSISNTSYIRRHCFRL